MLCESEDGACQTAERELVPVPSTELHSNHLIGGYFMGLHQQSGQVKRQRLFFVHLVRGCALREYSRGQRLLFFASLKLLSRGGRIGKLDHQFAYIRAVEKPAKGLRNYVKTFSDIFMRFQSTRGQPC